jgi:hypothetical protein
MTAFTGWDNFYVIVGSSAGALIGLQFVVLTLIGDSPVRGDLQRAGSAFGTPTVVHFGAVLLLAAVINVPWRGIAAAAIIWAAMGLLGLLYVVFVARRMRQQTSYSPEFEDWLFHVLLPFAAYAMLAGSAYAARSDATGALFAVGAAALLLLFIGIHNAWDAVTYHVFVVKQGEREDKRP